MSVRLLLAGLLVACAGPAAAHPHIWVAMHEDVLFGPNGTVTGIRHHWTFDDMFSAFAVQGMTPKVKGQFSREELSPLAKVNIESLKEYGYFTYATVDGKKAVFGDPLPGYWLDAKDSILTLNFTVPFKTPVKAKLVRFEIYDPTIFVDFEFAKGDAVAAGGAQLPCRLDMVRPQQITNAQSAKLGEQFFNALTAAQNWGEQYANKILVNCP
jgi:ABC-type uncharacterized transport system substrate-binding protein